MSKPTATQITRIPTGATVVDVYANGKRLFIEDDAGESLQFTPDEAKSLVEAITARLAEVTEGQ